MNKALLDLNSFEQKIKKNESFGLPNGASFEFDEEWFEVEIVPKGETKTKEETPKLISKVAQNLSILNSDFIDNILKKCNFEEQLPRYQKTNQTHFGKYQKIQDTIKSYEISKFPFFGMILSIVFFLYLCFRKLKDIL
ncbi:hypothetical protein M0812_23819 [Anaeramoeba flamelloides]|uniref:Uncharacterized protein n=1 Tax=Anaeramoeba flamelloides TaxID=1746091 RepID=A0AAV7YHY4_9EUKA|nr:hypothetical protein M0812_23819 [Anaeramoeba flamelloides]